VATADLTVLALGRAGTSASEYIAEIQRRLSAQSLVGYRMHAMGTSLEGSTADILAVVGELHAVPFEQGVPRVYTVLKLDERRDRPDQTLEDKVRSVEERLGDPPSGAPAARRYHACGPAFDREGEMAYTAEEIRTLLERYDRAVARHRRALGVWDWAAEWHTLDAELEETTARLSDGQRRTVGRFLEDWVEAQERHEQR
jgi:uncharacterized protein (TIGR00106 family)